MSKVLKVICKCCQSYKLQLTSTSCTPKKRNIKCQKCWKVFKNVHSLTSHMNFMHTKEKNIKCQKCWKEFANVVNLTLHINTIHTIHTHSKNLECQECWKESINVYNFTTHIKVMYTKEKILGWTETLYILVQMWEYFRKTFHLPLYWTNSQWI